MCDASASVSIELIAHLSRRGQHDALRYGVDPDPEVRHQITPEHELWERVVDLNPDITDYGVMLYVNRTWDVRVVNTKHDYDCADFLLANQVWKYPKVEGYWGKAQPLDEYPTLERAVEIAETNRQALWDEMARQERRLDEDIRPKWREWIGKTFLPDCRKDWERWTSDELPEQERTERVLMLVDLQLGIETLSPFADDAAEQAERLFEVRRKATEVIAERDRAIADRQRKRRLVEEAKTWAEEHGSSRLKKALRASLIDASLGVYRDERLAHEHPDWDWLPDEWGKQIRAINNPSERALDALLDAREWYPDAQLRWVNLHGSGSPIVIASFLDRQIFRPCDDPPPPAYDDFGDEPF